MRRSRHICVCMHLLEGVTRRPSPGQGQALERVLPRQELALERAMPCLATLPSTCYCLCNAPSNACSCPDKAFSPAQPLLITRACPKACPSPYHPMLALSSRWGRNILHVAPRGFRDTPRGFWVGYKVASIGHAVCLPAHGLNCKLGRHTHLITAWE